MPAFGNLALKRISLDMNQSGTHRDSYPPHPEQGASSCAFGTNKHSAASVSKDGAATDLGFTRDRHQCAQVGYTRLAMFETPRTRLRNLANPKLPAPHHEAGRDRGCIKLIGICFSVRAEQAMIAPLQH